MGKYQASFLRILLHVFCTQKVKWQISNARQLTAPPQKMVLGKSVIWKVCTMYIVNSQDTANSLIFEDNATSSTLIFDLMFQMRTIAQVKANLEFSFININYIVIV